MSMKFASESLEPVPVYIVTKKECEAYISTLSEVFQNWAGTQRFNGSLGSHCVLPAADGSLAGVLVGYGDSQSRKRMRFPLRKVAAQLPAGDYYIAKSPDAMDLEVESLGWLLSGYQFDRYKDQKTSNARLVAPQSVDATRVEAIASGEALARDLINTPTSDLGPEQLQDAFIALGETYDAEVRVVVGDDLLAENFPLIHTVGRASAQEPRLLEMRWGNAGPKLTLVGKGVCFDTGGLNIKPGASMGLMKKDMGGAANVMGLAKMIMSLGLPLQLRVLVPAVENSIDGSAFRPSDILVSRKGLTIEINNTDAEGRLVLADALALADEEETDLVVSMATLTGAARVAVGPDLAPYFSDDTDFVQELEKGAARAADPVWRLPFHVPYETMIEPGIADLDNAPMGGFAGSITAALFLRRFVDASPKYAHFDIYGWNPNGIPGYQKGGAFQGSRAILEALPGILDL